MVGTLIFNMSISENLKLILEEIHKLTSKSEKNGYPPSPKLLNKIPKLCCLTLK